MADPLEQARQRRDAAEAAARAADVEASRGVPGATLRAEALHREAQFFSARLAWLEADPAEQLKALYLRRERVCLAGRVAEAAAARGDGEAQAEEERLAATLLNIDNDINRLEASNDR